MIKAPLSTFSQKSILSQSDNRWLLQEFRDFLALEYLLLCSQKSVIGTYARADDLSLHSHNFWNIHSANMEQWTH
jgi:hypothetical protein